MVSLTTVKIKAFHMYVLCRYDRCDHNRLSKNNKKNFLSKHTNGLLYLLITFCDCIWSKRTHETLPLLDPYIPYQSQNVI